MKHSAPFKNFYFGPVYKTNTNESNISAFVVLQLPPSHFFDEDCSPTMSVLYSLNTQRSAN